MKNKNPTLIKILELKGEKFSTDADFERYFDIKPKTVDTWMRGISTSYMKILPQLADCFNVSTDYLLDRKKPAGEPMGFERFSEMLHEKGLSEKDIEKLSKEQLSTIGDIVKNFKP